MEKESYHIRCRSCGTVNRVPADSEGKAGQCGSCHAALTPLYTRPVALTDRSFDSFVAGYPGVIVAEFWAPW
jgi:uncharacterized paraquat-inducible protein A